MLQVCLIICKYTYLESWNAGSVTGETEAGEFSLCQSEINK